MGVIRSQRCQVCRHPERWRIDLLRAGGASLDSLAEKFGVDRDAIWRHWSKHVSDETKATYLCGPAQLAELAEKAASEGDSVLDHLRMVRTILTGQLAAMNEAGDARGVAYVAGRLTSVLETIARVTGELGSMAQSINITNNVAVLAEHPAFLRMQATMLRALAPFPDARASVVAALRDLDEEGSPAGLPGRAVSQVIDHVAA
ncbi:putative ArsR family transcriptional regulator [Bradyrhizobium diazoefficiens]